MKRFTNVYKGKSHIKKFTKGMVKHMKYLTRYYKTYQFLNESILKKFTIDNRAFSYNEAFYFELCKKSKDRYREFTYTNYLESELDALIHTRNYVGRSSYILGHLPTNITSQIADVRVFLLYVVSPTVYKLLEELCKNQERYVKEIDNALTMRYEEDQKKIPKHWLELYEIAWEDTVIFSAIMEDKNLLLTICDYGNEDYIITFENAFTTCNEGKVELPDRIYFSEIFYNEQKLELNILTPYFELTIEADDVTIENITPID